MQRLNCRSGYRTTLSSPQRLQKMSAERTKTSNSILRELCRKTHCKIPELSTQNYKHICDPRQTLKPTKLLKTFFNSLPLNFLTSTKKPFLIRCLVSITLQHHLLANQNGLVSISICCEGAMVVLTREKC